MHKFKAIGCGLAAAGALLFVSTAQATTFPVSYAVNVKTSFGTKFTDCFTFDGAGNLTVAGLGVLTYQLKNFNTQTSQFGAVAPIATATGVGFEITFAGALSDKSASIYGNDEQGDSYIVTGPASTTCSGTASTGGGSYRHP
jgi:hypothetical protein